MTQSDLIANLLLPAMLGIFLFPTPGSNFEGFSNIARSDARCDISFVQTLKLKLENLTRRSVPQGSIDPSSIEKALRFLSDKGQRPTLAHVAALRKGVKAGLEPEALGSLLSDWGRQPKGLRAVERVVDWTTDAKRVGQPIEDYLSKKVDAAIRQRGLGSSEKDGFKRRVSKCLEVSSAK